MNELDKVKICQLCNREVETTTLHHLIPKMLHSKKWYKKNFSNEKLNEVIELCIDCHRAIHQFVKEKDLGKKYNTLALLKTHIKIKNFISWVSKQNKKNIKTYRASRW